MSDDMPWVRGGADLADERAGGKEKVDAMVKSIQDLYTGKTQDQIRAYARFILLGLQEQGWDLAKS